jgi:hypothetical protein
MVLFLDLRYARLSVLVMEMQHLHKRAEIRTLSFNINTGLTAGACERGLFAFAFYPSSA